MTKKITKDNIAKELKAIFDNNTIIGNYEDRQKRVEEHNVSLPIQEGLYAECSLKVHLEKIGYNNSPNLHNYTTDFIADAKLKTVQIEIPNWSTPTQIRRKVYEKLTFYYTEGKEVSEIVEAYTKTIKELSEKRTRFVLDGNKMTRGTN